MSALAHAIAKWILHHFLTLLLIFCVLLLGRAGWAEWKASQSVGAESAQLA